MLRLACVDVAAGHARITRVKVVLGPNLRMRSKIHTDRRTLCEYSLTRREAVSVYGHWHFGNVT